MTKFTRHQEANVPIRSLSTLTKAFIEACKSDNNSIVVDTLNVWNESLPEFDYEAIGAKYKAVKHETMTEAESNIWERFQLLINAFRTPIESS